MVTWSIPSLSTVRARAVRILDGLVPGDRVAPAWRRRGRLLAILLLATILACWTLLLFILFVLATTGRMQETTSATLIIAALPALLVGLLVLSQRGHPRLAAIAHVLLVTTIIIAGTVLSGTDSLDDVVQGRSTFLLIAPVIVASVVLPPISSLAMAALLDVVLVVLSRWATLPVWSITLVAFPMIGLVAYLSARSLEKALSVLLEINRDLDSRVAERTRDLAAALERVQRVEAERLQSMKMAAVGQLAAGVAHEINNPLGVILGFARGMDRRVAQNDPLSLPVRSIVRESLRCTALVQELLTFSRTAKTKVEAVDINATIRGAAVMLEARAKTENIQVNLDLAEPLPSLLGNKTQLEQAIVNLGTNALDAMRNGGCLTLRTAPAAGEAALFVDVADTGHGISDEIRSRMFEPFFTTKEVGKGTGLGLSLVHGIVEQHGGSIDVQSEVGLGTTVRIKLLERGPGIKL